MINNRGKGLTPQQERDLVVSFEAKSELLPYLPYLLQDLWELGSVPSLYVKMLRPLKLLSEKTRVLDLGTGKGAVAVVLARELGFRVLGVDLYEPFLKEAKQRARSSGVSHLCRFEHEDMHHTLTRVRDYDLVLLISVGGTLGSWENCIGKLRRAVHPGGYFLIDDGFFKKGKKVERPGYEHYDTRALTLDSLTAHGDRIVEEVLYSDAETAALNRRYLSLIKQRVAELEKKQPDLKEPLRWYVQNQEEECRIIESSVAGACWLLQRSD